MSQGSASRASRAAQRDWFALIARRPVRVLVIQRDNIGDLVLITPFLRVLRACLHDARIDALVNSYNAPVLERNPDLDVVHVYVKAKHRSAGASLVRLYWERAWLWIALRRARYDLAILMTGHFSYSSLRPARVAGACHIAGYADESPGARHLDLAVDERTLEHPHVVRRSEALLRVLLPEDRLRAHWTPPMPACRVVADAALSASLERRLEGAFAGRPALVIAVHISARKVEQRWPVAHYIELMRRLHAARACCFVLLWAPGASDNALHPGDDAKAAAILAQSADIPVWPCPTETLPLLIAALSLADLLVCSDGGAMHLAAALACPIVALFGNSDPAMWHPWGPPYRVLRAETHKASDISVALVTGACRELLGSNDADR